MSRFSPAVALLLALSACAPPASPRPEPAAAPARAAAPESRGTLYVVGGGPQPPALVQEFVDLAGGAGRARIIVYGMASAEGRRGGESKAADFRALGATAASVWVDRRQADTDSVARLLDDATGVWFIGGDQNRLADVLRGTATERAIHARYAAGAVIGGTSAGAAVMSAVMLTGEERRPGGARPVTDSSNAFVTIDRDNVVVASGFGLTTDAIVDQHFLRRRRHNRLMSLVLERAPHLGVGIDESTALVIEPGGRWRVSGASVAVVYDARRAAVTPPGAPLGTTGMVVHVLPAGGRFDVRSGRATLPER